MKYFFLFVLFVIIGGNAHAQIITTIAGNDTFGFSGDGGPATAAEFKFPYSTRPDRFGNVYIADNNNNRLRKVDTFGIITTIAGTGGALSGDGVPATAAGLNGPRSIIIDAVGNIYFSESQSGLLTGHCVMKIDTAGILHLFAGFGTGIPGSGDGGPATAARFNNITDITFDRVGNMYIVDQLMSNLRKVDTAGIISTIAGDGTFGFSGDEGPATSAQLYQPQGVTVDNLENIYISDFVNQRVRKVDTAGIIITIAGTGTPGYNGDGGPATAAMLHNPLGVVADSLGNVYIADAYNSRIRKITDGIITTVAGDSTYGHTGDGGPATAAELMYPVRVALDDAENIFISDRDNNDVRKVTAPPHITTKAAAPVPANNALTIYPNPARGSFILGLPANAGIAHITITNTLGQKVKDITTTTQETEIPLTAPPGVYFINATTIQGRWTEKVVVTH